MRPALGQQPPVGRRHVHLVDDHVTVAAPEVALRDERADPHRRPDHRGRIEVPLLLRVQVAPQFRWVPAGEAPWLLARDERRGYRAAERRRAGVPAVVVVAGVREALNELWGYLEVMLPEVLADMNVIPRVGGHDSKRLHRASIEPTRDGRCNVIKP